MGYPRDLFDDIVGKIGDNLDLTETEAALLNVLAWWRRTKQETNPTYKFAFLWFAIESGIPASNETRVRSDVGSACLRRTQQVLMSPPWKGTRRWRASTRTEMSRQAENFVG